MVTVQFVLAAKFSFNFFFIVNVREKMYSRSGKDCTHVLAKAKRKIVFCILYFRTSVKYVSKHFLFVHCVLRFMCSK